MTRRTIIATGLLGLVLACTNGQRAAAQAQFGATWPVSPAAADLWPPESCQVVWVATVTDFDGMEVVLDVHESLKGDDPEGDARLTLPRPIPPAISRAFVYDAKTGTHTAMPPYEPLEFSYDPDRCGLVVGKRYLLYGLSTTDPASQARGRWAFGPKAEEQEVITLPSRAMSRAFIELTDTDRDEALDSARSILTLAAIEDRTEQMLAIIQAVPDSSPVLRGTLTRTLPTRLTGLPDKSPLVEPLLSLLDSTDPAIQLAALRAMNIDDDHRSIPAIPRRTPSEDTPVRVVETSDAPLPKLIELALADLPDDAGPMHRLPRDPTDAQMKAEVVRLAIGLVAIYDTPEALDALLTLAQHPHPPRRRLSAQLLAGFDDDRARQMRLALLDDSVRNVRSAAMYSIGSQTSEFRSFDPEVLIPKSIALLDDPDQWVRRHAARALGNSQDTRAVDALLGTFMDNDTRHQQRRHICDALSVLYRSGVGTESIVAHREGIVARMYTPTGWWSEQFAKLLKLMGTDEALDIILADSQAGSSKKRESVCRALTNFITEPRAAEILINLLDDPAPEVRCSAIYTIQSRTNRPLYAVATPKLIAMLDDPDAKVRRNAADAIGRYIRRDDADAPIDKLITMLKDPDESVRSQAAQALGGCSDDRPVAALLNAAGSTRGACGALRRLYRNGIGVEQIDARRDAFIEAVDTSAESQYVAIIDLLKEIARDEAVEAFVARVADAEVDIKVRRRACVALNRLGGQRADEGLINLLSNEEPEMRRLGASMLGRRQLTETLAQTLPPFVNLLEDSHRNVRKAAARGLRHDSPVVLDALLSGLSPQRDLSLAARELIVSILARNCAARHISKTYVEWVARDITPYVAVLNESTDIDAATHAITLIRTIGTDEAVASLQDVAGNHPVQEIATLASLAVEQLTDEQGANSQDTDPPR